MSVKVFSFFSGVGMLDLGFEKAGCEISLVNEFFEPFVDAYKYTRNFSEPEHGYKICSVEDFLSGVLSAELKQLVKKEKASGNIVGFIGGPPCPDFSVAGKNKGQTGENGKLSQTYIDLICEKKPDFFLFENVKGLWRTKKHREFYDSLKIKLKKNGYTLFDKLINTLEYGAPQYRERIILVGFADSLVKDYSLSKTTFPWDEYAYNKPSKQHILSLPWPQTEFFSENSIKKAPKDIPLDLTIQHWFNKNDVENHPNAGHYFKPRAGLEKFKVIQEGDDSKKSYKRLHRWRYSPTACYGNNEVHLHPYKARRISVAEALAIQSLPKDFCLPENMTLTNMYKTIGNGVPYIAALNIAKTIKYFMLANYENNSIRYSSRNRAIAQQQAVQLC